ncbi:EAL domain-containing protein [Bacillus tianshenii]|nr:EAL domain-containing protein [Bacillus tianshenii]
MKKEQKPQFTFHNGLYYAFVFTSIYVLVGGVGIFFLDWLISTIAENELHYQELTSFKGWIFLIFTACIMFYIALRFIYRDRVHIQELLQTKQELNLYGKVFEQMHEGLIITDERSRITHVNPSFEETTGYSKDEITGESPSVLNSGMHSREFYESMWTDLQRQGQWSGEIINMRKNGEVYPERLSITQICNEEEKVTNYIGVFTDISKQRKAEGKIEFLTHYDSLTRLPKLRLFMKHLNYLTESGEYEKNGFSLFIIDIGKLKQLNAAYGYKVGDELLQRAAARIQQRYRGYTIARVNSKEFALVLPGIIDPQAVTKEAEELLKHLESGFKHENNELFITANIGISTFPNDSKNADELYKYAMLAKTISKEKHRTIQYFGDEQQENVKRKTMLESHLHKALENNELLLYFQPQIDLKEEKICGLEVLMRWQHPELGLVSPVDFIPLAEETGLIIPFGEWVLETVCKRQQQWAADGHEPIKTAINLSPKQFQDPNLVKTTQRILEKYGVDRSLIEFEITESISMFQEEAVIETLIQLRSLGVEVSIDDFGTGHSNLSYLQKLPIDTLKIDRSFVWNIPDNKGNIALTNAIIAMAHELNLKVVAEGVETKEQMNFLQEQNCEYAQGFFFSRPLPEQEIIELLLSSKKDTICQA